jgi:hypothetical protein
MSADTTTDANAGRPVQAPPGNATEAAAKITALVHDPKFRDRLLSGDHEALQEWNGAHAVYGAGYTADELLDENATAPLFKGAVGGPSPAQLGTVELFRSVGISEPAIRQFFEGKPVSRAEHRLVEVWKSERMSNKEWTARYLGGDKGAQREMMLANIVLSNGYEGQQ